MQNKTQDLLDWAEALICNAKKPQQCTDEEWMNIVKRWRDEKHELLPSNGLPHHKDDRLWFMYALGGLLGLVVGFALRSLFQ